MDCRLTPLQSRSLCSSRIPRPKHQNTSYVRCPSCAMEILLGRWHEWERNHKASSNSTRSNRPAFRRRLRPSRKGQSLILEDGYYCPVETNQDTFDGFIFEKRVALATLLQATGGLKHFLKNGGFEYLEKLGVKAFRVIVLGTPINTTLDFAVLNSLCGYVSEVSFVTMAKIII